MVGAEISKRRLAVKNARRAGILRIGSAGVRAMSPHEGGTAMDAKTITAIGVVGAVVIALTLLPDFARNMKIRSM